MEAMRKLGEGESILRHEKESAGGSSSILIMFYSKSLMNC